jgi:hypothetical protein
VSFVQACRVLSHIVIGASQLKRNNSLGRAKRFELQRGLAPNVQILVIGRSGNIHVFFAGHPVQSRAHVLHLFPIESIQRDADGGIRLSALQICQDLRDQISVLAMPPHWNVDLQDAGKIEGLSMVVAVAVAVVAILPH